MRTIAIILTAVALALKDVAADKTKPFVILAGELKQITDEVKAKVEALRVKWLADVKAAEAKGEVTPAADPVCEIFDSYSGAANQHGAAIQFTIDSRKLQTLAALLADAPKPLAPPK